jgi:hypothetical protein
MLYAVFLFPFVVCCLPLSLFPFSVSVFAGVSLDRLFWCSAEMARADSKTQAQCCGRCSKHGTLAAAGSAAPSAADAKPGVRLLRCSKCHVVMYCSPVRCFYVRFVSLSR